MNTSALHPPNNQQLSENVIGDVVQRASRSVCSHTSEPRFFASPLRTSQLVQPQSLGTPKRPAVVHQLSIGSTELTGAHTRHTALMDTDEHEANAQAAAVEYFRLFRFGVQASDSPNVQTGAHPVHDAQVQQSFLEATTTPTMTDGTVCDVEPFMQRWIQMSIYFPNLAIELERLENGPGNKLIAAVKQNVTITQDMLLLVFPNVFTKLDFHLVSTLLGQQFMLHGLIVFEWDHSSNRVRGISYKTDLLTPLLRIVGRLEGVSRVFENARLTPDCGFSPRLDQ